MTILGRFPRRFTKTYEKKAHELVDKDMLQEMYILKLCLKISNFYKLSTYSVFNNLFINKSITIVLSFSMDLHKCMYQHIKQE